MPRDFAPLLSALAPSDRGSSDARAQAMRRFVDAAWPLLNPLGVSWIGFYTKALGIDGAAVSEMVLGPCRNKPACSPIGLHGVCGRGWLTRRSIIVRDVASLGTNYVACDPKDRSELVIPLFHQGHCYGVLDRDSFDIGAFSEHDADQLQVALLAMGLTEPGRFAGPTMVLLTDVQATRGAHR